MRHAWRIRILWCLLVALPLAGLSSASVQMLGAAHFHHAAASPTPSVVMAGWTDFRRADGAHTTRRQEHSHASWHRHHHAPADPTVASIDGAAADTLLADSSPGYAGAVLTWALGARLELHAAGAALTRWPWPEAHRAESVATEPPERPPRA